MKKIYLLAMTALFMTMGYAQYDITTIGTTQTIDFTGFDGSGFDSAPAAGQLDSDEWEIIGLSDGDVLFGGTGTTGDFARGASAGGELTGGMYSFDNGSGASLGFQAAGSDFTPGSMTLKISNTTGSLVTEIDLAYEVWNFNDQDRSNSLNFEHGEDNVNFTQESSLDFATPEAQDASPAWQSESRSITLTGLNIPAGSEYYLKWTSDDISGGGSRDEIAIDNIQITGYDNPSITADPSLLNGFVQYQGTPSPEQNFSVSGLNLTNDISVDVTSGDYEISLTSGSGFTNSITLPESGGTVNMTTIYVRLNGTTVADPANGDITVSSGGATSKIVTLEGQILPPDPVVMATPASLSGFSHFVGTPSAQDTINVSGDFLTDDLIVTAPANYEVSLSSGSGFGTSVSLTPTSGTVANTPVYVRLNGPQQNYNQTGDIVVSSTGATDENIALTGETLEYSLYPIGSVTTNDADGVADSAGVYVELRGIVHCIDFRDGDGYNVTIIDGPGDGIQVYNFDQVSGYNAVEGDSIAVKGQIDQFNGVTQVFAEEITVLTQGEPTVTPNVVTALDESTESQLVKMENMTLVNGEATWPSGDNIDITDGNNTFTVRVTDASPLANAATPNGPFDVTGIGGQYDSSNPYDEGYQLFPCSVEELCNVDITTTTTDLTIEANATNVDYQWIDCDDNDAPIAGETNNTFTATANGNYAVIITDGNCVDTSDCVAITTVGLDVQNDVKVRAYPNPVGATLNIDVEGATLTNFEITNVAGQIIASSKEQTKATSSVETASWDAGVYLVKIHTTAGTKMVKVVK